MTVKCRELIINQEDHTFIVMKESFGRKYIRKQEELYEYPFLFIPIF